MFFPRCRRGLGDKRNRKMGTFKLNKSVNPTNAYDSKLFKPSIEPSWEICGNAIAAFKTRVYWEGVNKVSRKSLCQVNVARSHELISCFGEPTNDSASEWNVHTLHSDPDIRSLMQPPWDSLNQELAPNTFFSIQTQQQPSKEALDSKLSQTPTSCLQKSS
jgi:hypothetical protein